MLGIVVIAVGGTLLMRFVQNRVWTSGESEAPKPQVVRMQAALIAVAVAIGFVFAFLPTEAFIDTAVESPYYIIPRAEAVAAR